MQYVIQYIFLVAKTQLAVLKLKLKLGKHEKQNPSTPTIGLN